MKAFPSTDMEDNTINEGMDLRDNFAIKILPALIEEYFAGIRNNEYGAEPDARINISVNSYRWADAMMEARECK